MKFHSLRTSLAGSAFALVAAMLLASCGGGGAAGNNTGGNLVVAPNNATFYAGVPATMTVAGGRRPYRITSSEPGIFPVPSEVNASSFTVVPSNPGVIDDNITAGQLPRRTVHITAIDAENNFQNADIEVAQNFLTGYGLSFASNCPVANGGTTSPPGCAGGETIVRLTPTFNGALVGLRTLRIDTERGPVTWLFPNGQPAGNSITLTTDHEGKAFAVFRADAGVATQFVIFRVTDVETGVSSLEQFILTGIPIASALTIIPDQFEFSGADTATCGTGSAQFLVFDGVPPYKAVSSFGEVAVNPSTSDDQPGAFTFNISNPNVCLSKATIIVTDSRLARGTVEIDTKAGSGTPPPPALRAVPASVTLTCAAPTANVQLTGGDPAGATTAVSADAQLTMPVAGRTFQVQWTSTTAGATDVPPTVTSLISASDGTQSVTITVRRPTDCL